MCVAFLQRIIHRYEKQVNFREMTALSRKVWLLLLACLFRTCLAQFNSEDEVSEELLLQQPNPKSEKVSSMLEQYLAERSRRRKRAAEYSLSLSSSQGKLAVDLGIKKDRAIGRKNNSGQRKKKIITHKKSTKKIKRLKANLKLAKVVLQLGVIVYKDVLPVVGALAISSGEMLKEKVVPAIKQLGHSAKRRAGRMADYTIQVIIFLTIIVIVLSKHV